MRRERKGQRAVVRATNNIDIWAAQEFLERLGAKKCTFQTFDDNGARKNPKLARILHGRFAEHADELAELNGSGAGVFVTLNQTDQNGRKRENVKRVRAVCLDLDGASLDPVRKCRLEPHLIVESSPGRWHAYWLVNNFPLDEFEHVQRAIAKRFDGDPGIARLTHCARLPGFLHNKDKPFRTRLLEVNDVDSYSAKEILAEFPPERKAHRPSISRKGSVVLPAGKPVDCAKEFVNHRFSHQGAITLHYYRGGYYEWTGTHYREREADHIRSELYGFLDKAHTIGDKGGAPFNPTQAKVSAILDALKSGVFQIRDRNAPFWLPPDLEHIETVDLIACKNGLLDIITRKLVPHSPHFFNINCLPFAYDPNAPSPKQWSAFLKELWPDDKQARLTLQEIFGLMLTADTSQQKMFMIVGPKRSGKGTIGRVLTGLLGKDNVAGPTFSSLGSQFGLWPLIDKRAAIISDARVSRRADSHIVAERLLSISGEDSLTIDRKYQDHWNGSLAVRFLILTNELPRIADTSGALASRYILLTLRETFYGKEDQGLTQKLMKELSGIMNWALRGLDRLRERGYFEMPKSSREALRTLEDLASPLNAFVRECCVVGPGQTVSVGEFWNVWKVWSAQTGISAGSKIGLGRNLHAAYPQVKRRRLSNAEYAHVGIGLSDQGRRLYEDAPDALRGKEVRRSREGGDDG